MLKESIKIIADNLSKVEQIHKLDMRTKQVVIIPEGKATIYSLGLEQNIIRIDIKYE
jgi:hypothetical protein